MASGQNKQGRWLIGNCLSEDCGGACDAVEQLIKLK
jgi:hypothetical protein